MGYPKARGVSSSQKDHEDEGIAIIESHVMPIRRDPLFPVEGDLDHGVKGPFLAVEHLPDFRPVFANKLLDEVLNGFPLEVELELLLSK